MMHMFMHEYMKIEDAYLYIGLWIPITVKEHNPIGFLQIQTQSTCT